MAIKEIKPLEGFDWEAFENDGVAASDKEAQAKAYRAQFQGEEETLLLEEICGYGTKQYWIGSTMRYVTGAVEIGAVEFGAVEIGENGACGTRCRGREAGGQEENLRPGMLLRGTFTGFIPHREMP